ncbi:Methyltransferase domain 25 [Sergentomyia squamirostris]
MTELDHYNPQMYSVTFKIRQACVNRMLELHEPQLKWRLGCERFMDIGCGMGDIAKKCFIPLLPRDFKKLVCADLSPIMLEAAQNELSDVEHVEFRQLDIRPPLESALYASVDRIFSAYVLMYIDDQKQAWQNIFDLLTPGGDCWVCLITTAAIFETFIKMAESPKWEGRLKNLKDVFVLPFRMDPAPEETIEKLLKSIGFIDIHVNKEDSKIPHPTAKVFKEQLRTFPSFSNNLTETEKEELLDDQVNQAITFNIIDEFHDPSKPEFQPRFQNMAIYARKP